MGNKEISQLSMFDYIIGITIGSIAAEMATALESDYSEPLTAMIVYALVAVAPKKTSDIEEICIEESFFCSHISSFPVNFKLSIRSFPSIITLVVLFSGETLIFKKIILINHYFTFLKKLSSSKKQVFNILAFLWRNIDI